MTIDLETPPASAAQLFRAWAPFVARQLARLGVDSAELDDAVQEVFLVVHRRGGMSAGPASERTFLTGIAVHVASNARRRRRRKPTVNDDHGIAAVSTPVGDPHAAIETRERLRRVAEAVNSLEPEARQLFVLLVIEGVPADEVACALGIPVGTVYSRAHAARRAFHAAYEARHVDPQIARKPGVLASVWGRLGRMRPWAGEEPAR